MLHRAIRRTTFQRNPGCEFDESPDLLVTEAPDQAMTARLAEVVTQATEALRIFGYSKALEYIEAFFWWFSMITSS